MKKIFISIGLASLAFSSVAYAAFPTNLSSWTSGNTITSAWANALEAKIGADNSAVTTSLDYLVRSLLLNEYYSQVKASSTVNLYVHASTTVAKAYSDNTFTGVNTFTQKVTIPTASVSDTDKAANVSFVLAQTSAGVASATPSIAGKARLSVTASNVNDPIVAGDNDPRLLSQWVLATSSTWNGMATATFNVTPGFRKYKISYDFHPINTLLGYAKLKLNQSATSSNQYESNGLQNSTLASNQDYQGWVLNGYNQYYATTTAQSGGEYTINNATSSRPTYYGSSNGGTLIDYASMHGGWANYAQDIGSQGITTLQFLTTSSTTGRVSLYYPTY